MFCVLLYRMLRVSMWLQLHQEESFAWIHLFFSDRDIFISKYMDDKLAEEMAGHKGKFPFVSTFISTRARVVSLSTSSGYFFRNSISRLLLF